MKLLLAFLFICPYVLYSQHSEHFKAITKHLKPVDSVNVETFYSNGNPKEKGKILYYKMIDDYLLEAFTGNFILYHNNGTVDYDMHYDRFGNRMSLKDFNRDKNLEYESVTYYLDTSAKNELDFIKNSVEIIYHIHEKHYRCSNKSKTMYLFKEGKSEDGKKVGTWLTYFDTGEIKNQKTY